MAESRNSGILKKPKLNPDRAASPSPPAAEDSGKEARTNSTQWVKLVDQIIENIPPAQDWKAAKKSFGLRSLEDEYRIIASLCGSAVAPGSFEAGVRGCMSKIRLRQLLNNFDHLISTSMCCVLERSGMPLDVVNRTMQLTLSNVGPRQLIRCRNGAKWVNKIIDELASAGWGLRATEIFFYVSGVVA